jgi:hypothetical protein
MLADYILDNGLGKLDTEADKLFICSQEPATYIAASSTYALGNKSGAAGSICSAPEARSPSGRKVVRLAITDGVVTTNGNATHQAIVDSAASRLHETGALSSTFPVNTAYPFSMAASDIGIPAA